MVGVVTNHEWFSTFHELDWLVNFSHIAGKTCGVQHQPDEITMLVWCEEHTKHKYTIVISYSLLVIRRGKYYLLTINH